MVLILSIMLTIFIISIVFEDKISYEYISTFENQPAVYVTEYGNCYHSADCYYLSQSKIEKGLYEAKEKGYRECKHCGSYSHGVTKVEHIEYFEITDYTNAFLFSCLRALLITPILYLTVIRIFEQRKLNRGEDENGGV